ncbi:MAG: L-threonylcarbamoyladenylate synthase [Candidatus Saganbacteria bacterium]|nr:L-threonylcarbamoyladenylate synthase [Candidatus Saganbacteria bacterium]
MIIKLTKKNQDGIIREAVRILRSGGLIVIPTETVYGIAADYRSRKAVNKIFRSKKRDKKPLQLLAGSKKQAKGLFKTLSREIKDLIKDGFPGPLTIVAEKSGKVPCYLTCGLNTVGVRMPDHAFVLKLIKALGHPIAATSANISGEKPARTAKEAAKYFKSGIDLIIDGGKAKTGKASKVIEVLGGKVNVLRK